MISNVIQHISVLVPKLGHYDCLISLGIICNYKNIFHFSNGRYAVFCFTFTVILKQIVFVFFKLLSKIQPYFII